MSRWSSEVQIESIFLSGGVESVWVVNSRVTYCLPEDAAPEGRGATFKPAARRELAPAEKQDHVEGRQDGDEQFDHERARLIEPVDHRVVQFAEGGQLFVYQVAVILDAHTGGGQAIDARVVDVADELNGVVDALGQVHYVEANGVEALRLARDAPA